MLNFIAIDLQLYKIYNIMQVPFFWHRVYIHTPSWSATEFLQYLLWKYFVHHIFKIELKLLLNPVQFHSTLFSLPMSN